MIYPKRMKSSEMRKTILKQKKTNYKSKSDLKIRELVLTDEIVNDDAPSYIFRSSFSEAESESTLLSISMSDEKRIGGRGSRDVDTIEVEVEVEDEAASCISTIRSSVVDIAFIDWLHARGRCRGRGRGRGADFFGRRISSTLPWPCPPVMYICRNLKKIKERWKARPGQS